MGLFVVLTPPQQFWDDLKGLENRTCSRDHEIERSFSEYETRLNLTQSHGASIHESSIVNDSCTDIIHQITIDTYLEKTSVSKWVFP